MNGSAKTLQQSIEDGSIRVGIIGLGYVGLPLALAFAETGHSVVGFDVDSTKVESITRGECYIQRQSPPAPSRQPPISCACERSTRS